MAPLAGPAAGPWASLAGLTKGSRVWWKKDPTTWVPAELLTPVRAEEPQDSAAAAAAAAAGAPKAMIQPLALDGSYIANIASADSFGGKAAGGGGGGPSGALSPVGKPVEVVLDALAPANPSLQNGIPDVVQLSHLTEPGILYNLGFRYGSDEIYTWAGPVLIALNPCKPLQLYTPEVAAAYKQAARDSVTSLPPHIYLVAAAAYRQMVRQGANQSLVVSGESGAGKTETTKKAMQYFATLAGGTGIEDQVLETNPVLEAFGNAKTLRNHNSSRFGKLIQIHFNASHHICGAAIKTYLLEKSRVAVQLKGERSFHIFYQLVRGAAAGALPAEEVAALRLPPKVQDFAFLSQSGCYDVAGMDDTLEFRLVCKALCDIGVSREAQSSVWRLLSGLLWLGNVEFEESTTGDSTKVHQTQALTNASELLGVSQEALVAGLTTRRILAPGEVVIKLLRIDEAGEARNSLAKAIYAAIFSWVVAQINTRLGAGRAMHAQGGLYIAILDIYGFEQFERNSFEQLCINYANERLQQQFTHHLFALEQGEYEREGIDWTKVEFIDNQDCVDVFELMPPKGLGLLAVLDSQCKFPRASDETLHNQLVEVLGVHSHFGTNHRVRHSFVIRHYAGDVQYDAGGLLEKCKDTLSADLIALMVDSHAPLLPELGRSVKEEAERSTSGKQTVITRFGYQLRELVSELDTTGLHFVRCIKPNAALQPNRLEPAQTLQQLRCCGVLEVARVAAAGFPTRYGHEEFARRYSMLLPVEQQAKLAQQGGSGLQACTALLQGFGLTPGQYQLGRTKVFFRPGVLGMIEDRWARMQLAVLSVQSYWRMYRCRARYLELRRAAIGVQALWRARACRLAYHEVVSRYYAALHIQAAWRGARERLRYLRILHAVVTIQTKGYRTWKFTRWLGRCLEARTRGDLAAEEERINARLQLEWLGALQSEYRADMDDVASALAAWRACKDAGVDDLAGVHAVLEVWQHAKDAPPSAQSEPEAAASKAKAGEGATPAAVADTAAELASSSVPPQLAASASMPRQRQSMDGASSDGAATAPPAPAPAPPAAPATRSSGGGTTGPATVYVPAPPTVVPRGPVMVMTPAVVTPAVVNRFELAQELAIQVERLNLENVKLQKQLHLEKSLKERYQHKAEEQSVTWLEQIRLLQAYVQKCRAMFGDSQLPPLPKQVAALTQPLPPPPAPEVVETSTPAQQAAPSPATPAAAAVPAVTSHDVAVGDSVPPEAPQQHVVLQPLIVAAAAAPPPPPKPEVCSAETQTPPVAPPPVQVQVQYVEVPVPAPPPPPPAPVPPRPVMASSSTQTPPIEVLPPPSPTPAPAAEASAARSWGYASSLMIAEHQLQPQPANDIPPSAFAATEASRHLLRSETGASASAAALAQEAEVAAQQHQWQAQAYYADAGSSASTASSAAQQGPKGRAGGPLGAGAAPLLVAPKPQNASQRYVGNLGQELDRVMTVLPDDVDFIQEVHRGVVVAPEMDPGAELFKLRKKFELWKREFKEKLSTAEGVLRKIEHMEGRSGAALPPPPRRGRGGSTEQDNALQPSASVTVAGSSHGPGVGPALGAGGSAAAAAAQQRYVQQARGPASGGGAGGGPGGRHGGAYPVQPDTPTPPDSSNGDADSISAKKKGGSTGKQLLSKLFRG